MAKPPPQSRKTVVVTGAGSGIGREVARSFLDAGYTVFLAGRRRAPLEVSAGRHPCSHVVPTDVTKADEVHRLFQAVRSTSDTLNVLFNNAGTFGPPVAIDELAPREWEETFAVNVTGSMLCAAAAFRLMKNQRPQGGRIINNGSIAAHSPRPQSVAYTTTKHAITGLTKSIELDGRPFGITCGQIDIGNAHTDMMDSIGAGVGAMQADRTRRVEPTFPVEEAAKAVVFMAELPTSATVGSLLITASGMPFWGRG